MKGWENRERASSACQAVVVEIGLPAVTRVHQVCNTTADRACYLLFSVRTRTRCCALPVPMDVLSVVEEEIVIRYAIDKRKGIRYALFTLV